LENAVHVEIIKYDIIVELKEAEGKIHEPQALVKEFYDAKKENRVIVVHIERPERPTLMCGRTGITTLSDKEAGVTHL
jgi:hypothetical protein